MVVKKWRKPNLEMRLFTLQDEFIDDFNKTGSTKVLGEKMFPYILEYAPNLIKAMLAGKRSLDNDELKLRAWDAATMLVEVIMNESDHRMHYSFGAYLGRLCKSACYITKIGGSGGIPPSESKTKRIPLTLSFPMARPN